MARVRRWRPFAIMGGAIFVVGVLLLWLLPYLASGTLERNAKVVGMIASLAGPVIAAASLGVTIRQRRQAATSNEDDHADQRERAAETLAEAVQQQWEAEAGMRSRTKPSAA